MLLPWLHPAGSAPLAMLSHLLLLGLLGLLLGLENVMGVVQEQRRVVVVYGLPTFTVWLDMIVSPHHQGTGEDEEQPGEDDAPEPLGAREEAEPGHDDGGQEGHHPPLDEASVQQGGEVVLLLFLGAAGLGAVTGVRSGEKM